MELTAEVKRLAGECGFARVGIAPAGEVPGAERLRQWLEQGFSAGMDYLAGNIEKRHQPRLLVDDAQCVICLAVSYNPAARDDSDAFIARYARGRDYHKVLKKRGLALCDRIRRVAPEFQGRVFVDTAPLAERAVAAAAGLGWIGRNGSLIVPGLGSYVMLAEIVCNLPLQPGRAAPGGCDDCHKCQAACPAGAIVDDGAINANRCLSYHTIENRGQIPREYWPILAGRVFGCDDCQAVCPHNRRKPPGDAELLAPDDARPLRLREILQWGEADWDAATRGSAMRRADLRMFLRNAIIAAGNSGDRGLLGSLGELRNRHDDGELAELIDWAEARISDVGGNEV